MSFDAGFGMVLQVGIVHAHEAAIRPVDLERDHLRRKARNPDDDFGRQQGDRCGSEDQQDSSDVDHRRGSSLRREQRQSGAPGRN